MPTRSEFYAQLRAFVSLNPEKTTGEVISAFPNKRPANVKHGLYYLETTGKLSKTASDLWVIPENSLKAASQEPVPEREFNALEVGSATIDSILALKLENLKLREELKECRELMSDYDRLTEDNRVLHERVTKLSTQLSASNAKTLRL